MKSKAIIFPQYFKKFEAMGENIKLARRRRKLTILQMSERTSIHRNTIAQIEKGDPRVSIGHYFLVLNVLHLADEIFNLTANDPYGRTLQDLELLYPMKKKNEN